VPHSSSHHHRSEPDTQNCINESTQKETLCLCAGKGSLFVLPGIDAAPAAFTRAASPFPGALIYSSSQKACPLDKLACQRNDT
jgi:hypothetical protein